MLEIVDIRDATEEEIKEYTRKQESPEWQQQGTVKDVMNKLSKQERRSMETKIVYGIRTERNICQQEKCLSVFARERCLNKARSIWI